MEAISGFKEWSEGQRRIYRAAADLHGAYLEAASQTRAFQGGMHWKRIKGRDYLYRYRDRRGRGGSLGPRSPDTERQFAEFSTARRRALEQLRSLRGLMAEQARFCRAAQLHRVPRTAARILRQLEQHGLGENLVVVDASAIYAYEFAAGAFVSGTEFTGLSGESHRGLTLGINRDLPAAELMVILRQSDRSFRTLPGDGFRAANHQGFEVRLLVAGSPPPVKFRQSERAAPDNLQYLFSSPKFSQVVIGREGFPVTMVVPDPRAFSLYKLGLSRQEGREEAAPDRLQALAVAELILRYLPQYHFFSSELRQFPEIVWNGKKSTEGLDWPEQVDIEY